MEFEEWVDSLSEQEKMVHLMEWWDSPSFHRDLRADEKLYADQQHLIDALKTMIDCFWDDPMSWMYNQNVAIEKARDAIAKATGAA